MCPGSSSPIPCFSYTSLLQSVLAPPFLHPPSPERDLLPPERNIRLPYFPSHSEFPTPPTSAASQPSYLTTSLLHLLLRSDFDLQSALACNVWLNHISTEIHFLASLPHPLPVFSFLYNFNVGIYIYNYLYKMFRKKDNHHAEKKSDSVFQR